MDTVTPTSARRALFLDRDGTIIPDKHYLADPDGVELLPGVAAALARARELGYALFLFTNQSGVARGYFRLDDVHRCNVRMEELIGLPAPLFSDICIATEGPNDPPLYRKPSPRFILESIARHGLDPQHCWMVGDREGDEYLRQSREFGAAWATTTRQPEVVVLERTDHFSIRADLGDPDSAMVALALGLDRR